MKHSVSRDSPASKNFSDLIARLLQSNTAVCSKITEGPRKPRSYAMPVSIALAAVKFKTIIKPD